MATLVQKTIKSSGGDYTSMSNLEAANGDLVSADQAWEVTASALEDTTAVNFDGWVTDETRYLKIKGDGYHSCTGAAQDTNRYRMNVLGTAFQINGIGDGGYIIFEDLQFKGTNPSAYLKAGDGNTTLECNRCVFYTASGSAFGFIADYSTTNKIIFRNCLFISNSNSCQLGVLYECYNCTFLSTGYIGFSGNNRNFASTHFNCYAAKGHATVTGFDDLGTAYTLTNCGANDDSGDPTSLDNIAADTDNFTNVTLATYDAALPEGSALIGVGASIAAQDYDRDLNGKVRNPTTPDLGAIEYAEYSNPHRRNNMFVLGA